VRNEIDLLDARGDSSLARRIFFTVDAGRDVVRRRLVGIGWAACRACEGHAKDAGDGLVHVLFSPGGPALQEPIARSAVDAHARSWNRPVRDRQQQLPPASLRNAPGTPSTSI